MSLSDKYIWLANIRWIAVLGVISAISFTKFFLKENLDYLILYSLVFFLFNFNLFFYLASKNKKIIFNERLFLNLQIFTDISILSLLVHFSGGIENPFIFYSVFHAIIAGIILEKKDLWIQTFISFFIFFLMAIFEKLEIINHYHIRSFVRDSELFKNNIYIFGVISSLASTIYQHIFQANYRLFLKSRLKMLPKQIKNS
jgi:hypothetical protein